ncbi:hypothetical protein JB92DRAFT_3112735 [Gautieria morchelliformis]|nr:hypothetical protein JB92DRAFT_3112735 [Gautieria morchelliformis]
MTPRSSTLLDRSQAMLKVRREFQGESHEDLERWVDDAVEVQGELRKVLHVEEVVDPRFEQPPKAEELAKEIQEVRVWLESPACVLHPRPMEAEIDSATCSVLSLYPSKGSEGAERTGEGSDGMGLKSLV